MCSCKDRTGHVSDRQGDWSARRWHCWDAGGPRARAPRGRRRRRVQPQGRRLRAAHKGVPEIDVRTGVL